MLGTPPPYNFSTSGVHPLHTSVLGIWLTKPYNFGTLGVHPLHTSVLRSSCLETNQVSPVLGPPLSPVLVYFSFLELTSYRSFVFLCLGFEPGRLSSVVNTLTM